VCRNEQTRLKQSKTKQNKTKRNIKEVRKFPLNLLMKDIHLLFAMIRYPRGFWLSLICKCLSVSKATCACFYKFPETILTITLRGPHQTTQPMGGTGFFFNVIRCPASFYSALFLEKSANTLYR